MCEHGIYMSTCLCVCESSPPLQCSSVLGIKAPVSPLCAPLHVDALLISEPGRVRLELPGTGWTSCWDSPVPSQGPWSLIPVT